MEKYKSEKLRSRQKQHYEIYQRQATHIVELSESSQPICNCQNIQETIAMIGQNKIFKVYHCICLIKIINCVCVCIYSICDIIQLKCFNYKARKFGVTSKNNSKRIIITPIRKKI